MGPELDVAIVGAGVAGLAAARLLARQGLVCCILEGSDVIGGRVRTVRRSGWQLPIELGAEFVHGRPAPTLSLGNGAIGLVHVPEQRLRAGANPESMPHTWPRFARALEGARAAAHHDSVADYLQQGTLSPPDAELVRIIVESYHAAPLADVSARVVAEDAASSATAFEQFRTAQGYDDVPRALEHELARGRVRVELATRVRRIQWSRGRVTLHAHGPRGALRVSAARCLVTASVGVLQATPEQGGIELQPRPPAFDTALPLLGMGTVVRVVLRFQQAPWVPALGGVEATFAHLPDAAFGTLWRETRAGQTQITAWAGGPAAQSLCHLEERALIEAALDSVARATQTDVATCRSALLEAHHHDFNGDELTRGAYSYVRPGGEGAAKELATPNEDTLFFAGEALDLQYPSTVAGALGSGQHAARQLLATWQR